MPDSNILKVNEIFYSIQGESTFAGLPCVFVRLTGCNLRCTYCDTKYAYDEGQDKTITEILESIGKYNCSLLEITGGEPLIQSNMPLLVDRLIEKKYRVLIETNGSQDISPLNPYAVKILDMKCPSSQMSEQMDLLNLSRISNQDEVKFVIGNREDYLWAKNICAYFELEERCQILFSAVFGKLPPQDLAKWILADHLRVRLQLQLHKYIWSPDQRGV
ncbi:MAG: radical SAM protein [Candidatus Tectomicrobia bacterium]|uniref:7-carboxy-7-deazaguanine synthase n=1 Tax=Tectimicrobiota bacterium TaxID=2528274 RepID=A0A933GKL9_UNCTE|nr:radical SAM protein [Candidatus Tectomicrobia bacterium]